MLSNYQSILQNQVESLIQQKQQWSQQMEQFVSRQKIAQATLQQQINEDSVGDDNNNNSDRKLAYLGMEYYVCLDQNEFRLMMERRQQYCDQQIQSIQREIESIQRKVESVREMQSVLNDPSEQQQQTMMMEGHIQEFENLSIDDTSYNNKNSNNNNVSNVAISTDSNGIMSADQKVGLDEQDMDDIQALLDAAEAEEQDDLGQMEDQSLQSNNNGLNSNYAHLQEVINGGNAESLKNTSQDESNVGEDLNKAANYLKEESVQDPNQEMYKVIDRTDENDEYGYSVHGQVSEDERYSSGQDDDTDSEDEDWYDTQNVMGIPAHLLEKYWNYSPGETELGLDASAQLKESMQHQQSLDDRVIPQYDMDDDDDGDIKPVNKSLSTASSQKSVRFDDNLQVHEYVDDRIRNGQIYNKGDDDEDVGQNEEMTAHELSRMATRNDSPRPQQSIIGDIRVRRKKTNSGSPFGNSNSNNNNDDEFAQLQQQAKTAYQEKKAQRLSDIQMTDTAMIGAEDSQSQEQPGRVSKFKSKFKSSRQ
ncbi:hypothetical protein MP228_002813 [Amoeboaphelidium protococcarum]|nr:hypothetical protein MP228_002813 [Amoeboaphelidium protococcarum]